MATDPCQTNPDAIDEYGIPCREWTNSYHYAMKKICAKKGYKYDPKLLMCTHTKETCQRDHDYDGLKDFDPTDLPYAEWHNNKCVMADYGFKKFCKREHLDYRPDKSGVGWCLPSKTYCEKKMISFSPKGTVNVLKGKPIKPKTCNSYRVINGTRQCVGDCYTEPGQEVAEQIFGTTVTRGTKALFAGQAGTCKPKCLDDQFCAGANNCVNKGFPGVNCLAGQNVQCRDYLSCNEPAFKECCPDGVGGRNTCKGNPMSPYQHASCDKCCQGTREECIKRGRCLATTCAFKNEEDGKYYLPAGAECSMAALRGAFKDRKPCGYYFEKVRKFDQNGKKIGTTTKKQQLSCRGMPMLCRKKSKVGEQCTKHTECRGGLWCSGFACKKKGLPGAHCPLDGKACFSGKCSASSRCLNPDGTLPDKAFCLAGTDKCGPNSYCAVLDKGISSCQPKKNLGATCLSGQECKSKQCFWGKCVSGQAGGIGAACTVDGKQPCKSGLWCGGFPVQCRARGGQGAPCLSNRECVYNCVQGQCTDSTNKLPKNAPCANNDQCKTGYVCRGFPAKCLEKGKLNDPCNWDTHCNSPYKCINNQCKSISGIGGSCSTDNHCTGSLVCKAGRCVDPKGDIITQTGQFFSGLFGG